jgi:hypothetical protein
MKKLSLTKCELNISDENIGILSVVSEHHAYMNKVGEISDVSKYIIDNILKEAIKNIFLNKMEDAMSWKYGHIASANIGGLKQLIEAGLIIEGGLFDVEQITVVE